MAQSQTVHLPQQPTPFIGREQELKELGTLLADPSCRLLTLVGPGGIGKTPRYKNLIASPQPAGRVVHPVAPPNRERGWYAVVRTTSHFLHAREGEE